MSLSPKLAYPGNQENFIRMAVAKISDPGRVACHPFHAPALDLLHELKAPASSIHGCRWKYRLRSRSSTITQLLSEPAWSTWLTIARQTRPSAGSGGAPGSPFTLRTARTTPLFGRRFLPINITVGTPCPGMYAPEVSII